MPSEQGLLYIEMTIFECCFLRWDKSLKMRLSQDDFEQ